MLTLPIGISGIHLSFGLTHGDARLHVLLGLSQLVSVLQLSRTQLALILSQPGASLLKSSLLHFDLGFALLDSQVNQRLAGPHLIALDDLHTASPDRLRER